MVHLKNVPLSGDRLVDWIFKQFIILLRKETLHIRRRKRVIDKDLRAFAIKGKTEFHSSPHHIDIQINSSRCQHASRNEELDSLIHELSHILFRKFTKKDEPAIEQMEDILIARFTQEQRRFLKSFLPGHEVKK